MLVYARQLLYIIYSIMYVYIYIPYTCFNTVFNKPVSGHIGLSIVDFRSYVHACLNLHLRFW